MAETTSVIRLEISAGGAVKVLSDVGAAGEQAATRLQDSGKKAQAAFGGLGSSLKMIGEIAAGISLAGLLSSVREKMVGLVEGGIAYNATIERSSVAVAAMLQATTQLVDRSGKTADAITMWQVNLKTARALHEDIALASVKTLGTAEELTHVFETVLAFSAGQKTDAKSTLDFEHQRLQVAEGLVNIIKLEGFHGEIVAVKAREIVGLTAMRDQSLLKILGTTIQQARQMQQQGVWMNFLLQKTQEFDVIAKSVATSWTGLTTTVETFKNLLSAQAFSQTFVGLKQVLIGMADEFQKLKNQGGLTATLGVTPQELQRLGIVLADVFASIVKGVAEATNNLLAGAASMSEWVKVNKDWLTLKTAESFHTVAADVISLGPGLRIVTDLLAGVVKTYLSLPPEVQAVGIIAALLLPHGVALITAAALAVEPINKLIDKIILLKERGTGQGAIQLGAEIGAVSQEVLASLEQLTLKVGGADVVMKQFNTTAIEGAGKLVILGKAGSDITEQWTRQSNALAASEAALKKQQEQAIKSAKSTEQITAANKAYAEELFKVSGSEAALAQAHATAVADILAKEKVRIAEAIKNKTSLVDVEKEKNVQILAEDTKFFAEQTKLGQKALAEQEKLIADQLKANTAQVAGQKALIQAAQDRFNAEKTLAELGNLTGEQKIALVQKQIDFQRQLLEAERTGALEAIRLTNQEIVVERVHLLSLQLQLEAWNRLHPAIANAALISDIQALTQKIKDNQTEVEKLGKEYDAAGQKIDTLGVTAAADFERIRQEEAKLAFISSTVIGDMVQQIATGILQGTQSLGNLFAAAGQSLALRFADQFIRGKNQHLDIPFIGNISKLVFGNNGGLIGAIFGQGGQLSASNFVNGWQGIWNGSGVGSVFTSSGQGAAQTFGAAFLSGIKQIFSGNISGGLGTIFGGPGGGILAAGLGDLAGTFFSKLFGLSSSQEAKIGGQVGSLIGSIIAFAFSGPLASFLGSFLGNLLGSIFGGLFEHIPTKGTQIRQAMGKWLKDIGVSFADQIDTGNYFFEATKALAKQMFGGDFLPASEKILRDKVGPDLAKQLTALGTALTGHMAQELGKSVEQTGTTFGNLLVANLGIDKIPDAIKEIVEKGKITFGGLVTELNRLFQAGAISVGFYKDALEGAVGIFFKDFPKAIDIMKLMNDSMVNGVLDLKKFQAALTQIAQTAATAGQAAGKAISDGIAQSLSTADVKKNFTEALKATLRQAIIDAEITKLLADLFAGIDLTVPLTAEAIQKMADKVGIAYENVVRLLQAAGLLPEKFNAAANSAQGIVDKIKAINQHLDELNNKRIQIRVDYLTSLEQIGAITPLQAATGRRDIHQQQLDTLLGASPIGTRPFAGLTTEKLEKAIGLTQSLIQDTIAVFNAQVQGIQAAAQAQIEAVNAAERAQEDAIHAEFQARQDAIRTEIDGLNRRKKLDQEFFQAALDGLNKSLQVAQSFKQVADSLRQSIVSLTASAAQLSKPEQFAFLQRQADFLRQRLTGASLADQPAIIQQLAGILQQQLSFAPAGEAGKGSLNEILSELTALQNNAAVQGDKVAEIQAQILDVQRAEKADLDAIDAQIEALNRQSQDLAKQESDAIKAAQDAAQAQIKAIQDTAQAQIDTLRSGVAQKLKDLYDQQDHLLSAQIDLLTKQKQVLTDQLEKTVGKDEAKTLLSDPLNGMLLEQVKANELLASIDARIGDLTSKIRPAQGGFEGYTTGTSLLAVHPNERVSIRPVDAVGTPTGVSVTLDMSGMNVNITGNMTADAARSIGRGFGEGLDEAMVAKLRTGKFGRELFRVIGQQGQR